MQRALPKKHHEGCRAELVALGIRPEMIRNEWIYMGVRLKEWRELFQASRGAEQFELDKQAGGVAGRDRAHFPQLD